MLIPAKLCMHTKFHVSRCNGFSFICEHILAPLSHYWKLYWFPSPLLQELIQERGEGVGKGSRKNNYMLLNVVKISLTTNTFPP